MDGRTEQYIRNIFADELARDGFNEVANRVRAGENPMSVRSTLRTLRRLIDEPAWPPPPSIRAIVYSALDSERDYQDSKYNMTLSSGRAPTADFPAGFRTIDEYSSYIAGYAMELLKLTATKDDPKEKLAFVRKVGALCVACMEWHGAPRREGF